MFLNNARTPSKGSVNPHCLVLVCYRNGFEREAHEQTPLFDNRTKLIIK